MKTIKVLVNGRGGVGKTCLLISYVTKNFPDEYVPTVFDNYDHHVVIDGEQYIVDLWDTGDGEVYCGLRPQYPQADVFLACFSLVDFHSFQKIFEDFVPEFKHHCPGSRI